MNKANRSRIGQKGEDKALSFLESKSYVLLERNFRSGKYEIDLLMRDGNQLVAVEVKTTARARFLEEDNLLSPGQIGRISKALHHYLYQEQLAVEARVDLVTVEHVLSPFPDEIKVEHYPNIL
jgi:putative endonuclease